MATRRLTKREKYLVGEITRQLCAAEIATIEAKNEIIQNYGLGYEGALRWMLNLIQEK